VINDAIENSRQQTILLLQNLRGKILFKLNGQLILIYKFTLSQRLNRTQTRE